MREYEFVPNREDMLLSELICENGIDFDMPCAGNHKCGKCKVKAEGGIAPMMASEASFLTEDEIKNGYRMACFAKVMGPVKIYMEEEKKQQILTEGSKDLVLGTTMMEKGYYGAAIDIGTTTVVCSVFSTESTEPVAIVSEKNRQERYGADVISRINYGIQNGNQVVHDTIRIQLEDMLKLAAKKAGIDRKRITHAVVTGNTTMMHFFANRDPRGIGFLPFVAETLFDEYYENVLEGITAYIPPCVSAYVGADTMCCVLDSGMYRKNENSLIIDIGTNGEMALTYNGVMYACSTAAGPAFEGAGISMGMMAQSGAVSHAEYNAETGKLEYSTLNDDPARGICGSGLIDTVAALIIGKAIDATGKYSPGTTTLELIERDNSRSFCYDGTNVVLTQTDIRQLQLAKAAIFAGIQTMLDECNVPSEVVDIVYICGGFGSFLNLKSAETIGLLPRNSKEKTVVLGNGALIGASKILLDTSNIPEIVKIKEECQYIELSDKAGFMENYIESMNFEV